MHDALKMINNPIQCLYFVLGAEQSFSDQSVLTDA